MRTLLILTALTTGCIEQGLYGSGDGLGGDGSAIEVEPMSIDFGALSASDDAVTESFVIRSVGVTDLQVEGIVLSGSGDASFTLLAEQTAFVLPPGTEEVIDVVFAPMGAAAQSAVAIVSSSDAASPTVPVSLAGEGLVAELDISPDPLDFGGVGVGCDALENITLTNVGTEPLTITALAESGAGFALTSGLSLPLDLAPQADATVQVTFTPDDAASFSGALAVTSTEPMGTRTAEQSGEGAVDGVEQIDSWEIPSDPPTDILFSLDSSCSMTWDIWEMYANFDAFINELETYSEDWQIIVANEDDGCNNSGILTPSTADYTTKFQEALFAWNFNDDYTEALLTVNNNAVQATSSGDCNAGFLRPDAMLHIIDITDEPEQSQYISGQTWDQLVDEIVTKKGSLALTTISAIAGDYPGGCDDASAGTGYYEAVQATGGVFLSICQDWSNTSNLGLLAEASVSQDTFALSQPAQESTISVTVNGQSVSTWSYDAATNSVVFSSNIPSEGDAVEITYTTTGSCEG